MSILKFCAFPEKPRFAHITQTGKSIDRASYYFPNREIFFQTFTRYQLEQDRVLDSKILEADRNIRETSSPFHKQPALLLARPLKILSLAFCSVSEQDTASHSPNGTRHLSVCLTIQYALLWNQSSQVYLWWARTRAGIDAGLMCRQI